MVTARSPWQQLAQQRAKQLHRTSVLNEVILISRITTMSQSICFKTINTGIPGLNMTKSSRPSTNTTLSSIFGNFSFFLPKHEINIRNTKHKNATYM